MLHQVRVEARMLPHYDKREISGKELFFQHLPRQRQASSHIPAVIPTAPCFLQAMSPASPCTYVPGRQPSPAHNLGQARQAPLPSTHHRCSRCHTRIAGRVEKAFPGRSDNGRISTFQDNVHSGALRQLASLHQALVRILAFAYKTLQLLGVRSQNTPFGQTPI